MKFILEREKLRKQTKCENNFKECFSYFKCKESQFREVRSIAQVHGGRK